MIVWGSYYFICTVGCLGKEVYAVAGGLDFWSYNQKEREGSSRFPTVGNNEITASDIQEAISKLFLDNGGGLTFNQIQESWAEPLFVSHLLGCTM